MKIDVGESQKEEIFAVHDEIPEFDEGSFREKYGERIPKSDSVSLIADLESEAAGYSVAYDKFGDGSFYLWMAGVKPDFRRQGVMSALLEEIETIAKDRGYDEVKIKTRNGRKAMRHLLIDHGYQVCDYNEFDNLERCEIVERKSI